MPATANNTANVSTGKGVRGGYFFLAPAGTALPTDNTTALAEEYLNMGYLGDDGVVFSDSSTTDTNQDLNGDTIDTSTGAPEKTFRVTFREVKRDVLAVLRGEANVTDEGGKLTAYDRGPNDAIYVGVFELLLKNGRKWRRIVPQCSVGDLGDETIVYNQLVGRQVTMTALMDATVNAYYVDYIDSTETTAAGD